MNPTLLPFCLLAKHNLQRNFWWQNQNIIWWPHTQLRTQNESQRNECLPETQSQTDWAIRGWLFKYKHSSENKKNDMKFYFIIVE